MVIFGLRNCRPSVQRSIIPGRRWAERAAAGRFMDVFDTCQRETCPVNTARRRVIYTSPAGYSSSLDRSVLRDIVLFRFVCGRARVCVCVGGLEDGPGDSLLCLFAARSGGSLRAERTQFCAWLWDWAEELEERGIGALWRGCKMDLWFVCSTEFLTSSESGHSFEIRRQNGKWCEFWNHKRIVATENFQYNHVTVTHQWLEYRIVGQPLSEPSLLNYCTTCWGLLPLFRCLCLTYSLAVDSPIIAISIDERVELIKSSNIFYNWTPIEGEEVLQPTVGKAFRK